MGNASAAVFEAIQGLKRIPNTRVCAHSSFYQSAPIDSTGPDYINAVVRVATLLCAPDLLIHLQSLEISAGRERPFPNAPRTLDLDLLLYGSATISSDRLNVPHPRMWQRAFVVVPLAELNPALVPSQVLLGVQQQVIRKI